MEGTVINNTSDDNIKIYVDFMDIEADTIRPRLQDLPDSDIYTVSKTSSDVVILGHKPRAYVAVWSGGSQSGNPDSWVVFNTHTGDVVDKSYGKYGISITGNDVITVTDRTNYALLIILAVVLVLLVGVGVGIGLYLRAGKSY